uniref:Eukaryotic translation initiation factor 3 subunit B-like n=1 Tax=Tanacetum cinerariifolium TaxID=118510 RepID=A0A6L2N7X0_TANCI|nr:eukaryotic translation initiation factor 3 subunit B-like [Tanacetum cinerariifolium]
MRDLKGSTNEFAISRSGGIEDKYFARKGKNVISVYKTKTFSIIDKKDIKVENVMDLCWSPTDCIFALYVPELNGRNQPARVYLFQISGKEELRQKNLFSVSDCKMYWQSNREYLAVKVDRYTKTKKSTYNGFKIFRIKERDIPIEVFKLDNKNDKVTAFCWESKEEIIPGSASQFMGNGIRGSGSGVTANGVNGFVPGVTANGVEMSVLGVMVNGVVANGTGGSAAQVMNDGVSRSISEVVFNGVSGSVARIEADAVIANDVGGSAAHGMTNGASGSVSKVGVNGVSRLVSKVQTDGVIANGVGGSFDLGMTNGVSRVREYRAIAAGLRITVYKRRERICRLEALRNCQEVINTIRFWERMQIEDVEKGTCTLLMMREMEAKIREKAIAVVEDSSLVREINGLCAGLTARIKEREYFIDELDTLVDRFVPEKMAVFLKKTQDKDRNKLTRLQILGREFELRLREEILVICEKRMNLVDELRSIRGIIVVEKAAEFVTDTLRKDSAQVAQLRKVESQMESRAFEKELFIQKLVGNCRMCILFSKSLNNDVVKYMWRVTVNNKFYSLGAMFILYRRWYMGEDYMIALEINMMASKLNSVVIEKDQFLEELDSIGVRPVPAKTTKFMREI